MVAMSRFIDERGRIFGKVNVVDILVLLVIVAVVAFAVMRLTGGGSEPVSVTVTYTVEGMREVKVASIKTEADRKGSVKDDQGTLLGEIQAVGNARPSEEEFPAPTVDENGKEGPWELHKGTSTLFTDLDMTVRGEGRLESDGSIYIGDVKLLSGEVVTLEGAKFKVSATIMSWEY
jgi:hypothetical protein